MCVHGMPLTQPNTAFVQVQKVWPQVVQLYPPPALPRTGLRAPARRPPWHISRPDVWSMSGQPHIVNPAGPDCVMWSGRRCSGIRPCMEVCALGQYDSPAAVPRACGPLNWPACPATSQTRNHPNNQLLVLLQGAATASASYGKHTISFKSAMTSLARRRHDRWTRIGLAKRLFPCYFFDGSSLNFLRVI
mgnify:CR=1 FL=1